MTRSPIPAGACPALLALLLCLPSCAPGTGTPGGPSPPAGPSARGDLASVEVLPGDGSAPRLRFPVPFSVTTTRRRVLRAGDGAPVTAGQRIDVRYVGVNGTDGQEFDSAWDSTPRSFLLDREQNLPGLVTGLIGTRVGSRVLVAVPPREGFGLHGSTSDGIGPSDTLVVVVDLLSARSPLARATGTPVPAGSGLPTVARGPSGRPAVTVPAVPAPTSLVSRPLLLGTGPVVRAGNTVTVHYTGVVWDGGRRFDSSWDRGRPETFTIGTGSVIDGWDDGLTGRRVGSQILLVVPPRQGFGPRGRPEVHVTGSDTLVFVVDILDAG